ncbi:MacB-like periplasmic core domain protein [uncultured archaeon]|nr:MacB-like periplasmic core domain protein [uncultured archaeon]
MKLWYTFSLALDNIRHRNLRSWLTILGIVIGVASIVSLISISIGVSNQISARVSTLGSNIIQISPGGAQAQRVGGGGGFVFQAPGSGGNRGGSEASAGRASKPITFREADDLRILPGVYRLDARLDSRETVKYGDKNTSLSIIGTEPAAFKDSVGTGILYGRYLSTSDQYSAVVGFGVANSTFQDIGNNSTSQNGGMLNKQIKINDVPFKVVGILNESEGGGFGSSNNVVFIPQKTAQSLFNQTKNASQLVVVVAADHDTDTVAAELENALINLHHVTNTTMDFQVATAASIQSTVSSITDTLGMLLGGIASISLIVGGIGVANTMFMSVLEQTKDIGVLKSIGAKNRDVVLLFLCEAAVIGLVGGLLGVLLSFGVSEALSAAGVPTALTPELLLGAVVFSVVIGIIAGAAPSRRAAAIPPVEALRYE